VEAKFANVPDKLWDRVAPLLPKETPKPLGGRPRVSDRKIFAGVMYRLRTGCQWKALPEQFGSGSTCHRRFSEWVAAGVFDAIFERMLKFYNDKRGIQWQWTSLDGAIVKAPKGGRSQARTRRTAPSAAPRGTSSSTGAASR
jgi:transposase